MIRLVLLSAVILVPQVAVALDAVVVRGTSIGTKSTGTLKDVRVESVAEHTIVLFRTAADGSEESAGTFKIWSVKQLRKTGNVHLDKAEKMRANPPSLRSMRRIKNRTKFEADQKRELHGLYLKARQTANEPWMKDFIQARLDSAPKSVTEEQMQRKAVKYSTLSESSLYQTSPKAMLDLVAKRLEDVSKWRRKAMTPRQHSKSRKLYRYDPQDESIELTKWIKTKTVTWDLIVVTNGIEEIIFPKPLSQPIVENCWVVRGYAPCGMLVLTYLPIGQAKNYKDIRIGDDVAISGTPDRATLIPDQFGNSDMPEVAVRLEGVTIRKRRSVGTPSGTGKVVRLVNVGHFPWPAEILMAHSAKLELAGKLTKTMLQTAGYSVAPAGASEFDATLVLTASAWLDSSMEGSVTLSTREGCRTETFGSSAERVVGQATRRRSTQRRGSESFFSRMMKERNLRHIRSLYKYEARGGLVIWRDSGTQARGPTPRSLGPKRFEAGLKNGNQLAKMIDVLQAYTGASLTTLIAPCLDPQSSADGAPFKDSQLRLAALELLLARQPEVGIEKALSSNNRQMLRLAIDEIAKTDRKRAANMLIDYYAGQGTDVSHEQTNAFRSLGKAGTEALFRALASANWKRQLLATRVLVDLGEQDAVEPLLTMLESSAAKESKKRIRTLGLVNHAAEERKKVLEEAIRALGELQAASAIPILMELAVGHNRDLQPLAIDALGKLRHEPAIGTLEELFRTGRSKSKLRESIIRAMGQIGTPEAVHFLLEIDWRREYGTPDALATAGRRSECLALIEQAMTTGTKDQKALASLAIKATKKMDKPTAKLEPVPRPPVDDATITKLISDIAKPKRIGALDPIWEKERKAAIDELSTIGSQATPHLLRLLKRRNPRVQKDAIMLLGRTWDLRAVKPLAEMLVQESGDVAIVTAICGALGEIGGPEPRAALKRVMESPALCREVRKNARYSYAVARKTVSEPRRGTKYKERTGT